MDGRHQEDHQGRVPRRGLLEGTGAPEITWPRALPRFAGQPIRIAFQPDLRVARGKLVARGGTEVHAATWLRRRVVLLDAALRCHRGERNRILVHELFHFVWIRLANRQRDAWLDLLGRERVRGELGWSAELRKQTLSARDRRQRTRRWRDYACESFCDTAAWLYSGVAEHEEFTLPQRARLPRRRYFDALRAGAPQGLRI